MKRPRAILFDHDGTLVNSEGLHAEAWVKLCEELGFPCTLEESRRNAGKTAPEIMARLLDQHLPDWRLPENAGRYDLEALALRKNDHYLKLLKDGLRPYPGVVDCLKWLQTQGIPAAVVSNAKRRELTTALDGLGLTPYFTAIVSRDDAGAFKPDPTPYLVGAAHVGVEPGECLAVEDSPVGLEAALMAGVPAAAVTTNFSREVLAQPVPGRPDLRPVWVGDGVAELLAELRKR